MHDGCGARIIEACPNSKTCEYLRTYCETLPGTDAIAQGIPQAHLRALLDRNILDYTKMSSSLLSAVGYAPESPDRARTRQTPVPALFPWLRNIQPCPSAIRR